jgi:glycosyltransferase involved in cell wall biosynthesis
MRVLMVEASGRGFLNHYSHALSLGLHWAGIDVQLLTGKRDELNDRIVPFHKQACLDSGRSGWRCLRRHIAEEKPDVVHLQWVDNPFSALQFVRWAKKRDIGVVYTPHNILPHQRRWLLMPVYRALYRHMHKVVARDPHLAWALEELLDTPQDRVELLPGSPNVLALQALNQSTRSPCPERIEDEQRLLFFGHGSTRKGLDTLLATVSENKWPHHLHLVVAGEDVLQDISEDLLSRARKAMRLTLIDRYLAPDEVAVLFQDADLLLMPYIKLCKSPLLDLAAALRLPVLRSDRVQGADFREGLHGFTFSHTDLEGMGNLLKETGWLENVKRNLGFLDEPAVAINRLADGHKRLYLRVKEEVGQQIRNTAYSETPLPDPG